VCARGRIAESLRWVTQILNAAETSGDPDLLIVGHTAAVLAHFWLGDPIKSREHADKVLTLYTEERHGHLAGILNHDPKTVSLGYLALATWMLGYPEQAVRISDAKDVHARWRGHPFDLGCSLTILAEVFDFLREPDELLKRVEEADRVARENSVPILKECVVPVHSGIALIRKGQVPEGIALLERGTAVWPYNSIIAKSVLAEGMAQRGDLAGALDLINDVITQIERPGWEERRYYAEALRIKGEMLARRGDLAGAERSYLASLDWARRQQAKSWELRTATGYARLMREQGRVREAHDLLAPVYGWFTEGFGTKDLKEAKALLDELADAPAVAASGGLAAAAAGAAGG
jgi:predicted ATPase